MTQANCQGKEVVNDGVGMAAYTMDSHNIQRIVIEKDGREMVKNEGNVEVGGFGPYPISYRSLIPKDTECQNLLVPVCLPASHIAYGSIRMEPVFMVLGQSSALAAVMAIDAKISVQKVNISDLQKELIRNPLATAARPKYWSITTTKQPLQQRVTGRRSRKVRVAMVHPIYWGTPVDRSRSVHSVAHQSR